MSEALVERFRNTMPQYLRGLLSSDDVEGDLNEAADRIEADERKIAELEMERDDLAQRAAVIDEALTNAIQLRIAAEADKARLSEALRNVRADCQSPIDLYHRVGPSFTSPGGDEYEPASYVMDKMQELITRIDAALSGSGSGWRLVPNGEPVTLDDCPEGLFLFNGYLGFMTEYATDKNDGFRQRDAYCVDSGEYFWGGTSNARERAKLIVQPMLPAAPQQGGE